MLTALPVADTLIADREYDINWYRESLADKSIEPCITSRKKRKEAIPYDEFLYRQRNLVERMFGKLKDLAKDRHA